MSSRPEPGATAAPRLTRSISATWWYIAVAIGFFQLTVVLLLVDALVTARFGVTTARLLGAGGLVWWAVTLLPLRAYRHRAENPPLVVWRLHLAPLVVSVVYGAVAGPVTGAWLYAVLPLAQALVLLNWPPGVRARVTLAVTALLAALAVVDVHAGASSPDWYQLVFFAVLLPVMTVSSLWWWDVLVRLDRARASEARLAATQERLRLAHDVHDLQGHHLQVVALQLELAERLMPQDPEAGMEQLRAARASVDDARQGTRDLATRFRSVPLRDELANAADLLRAAGTSVRTTVDPGADDAPADALGPVIRETTTNVLRHGGGRWAHLSLARTDGAWRYEIANDVARRGDDGTPDGAGGSGLEGLARRAADVGGHLVSRLEGDTFTVVVTVPDRPAEPDPQPDPQTTPQTEEETAR